MDIQNKTHKVVKFNQVQVHLLNILIKKDQEDIPKDLINVTIEKNIKVKEEDS